MFTDLARCLKPQHQQRISMKKEFQLEVNPTIPSAVGRLSELASDLRYSWDRPTRELYGLLDPLLWNQLGHNPKLMLRNLDEAKLSNAAANATYLSRFQSVLAAYDHYHDPAHPLHPKFADGDLIAYFCAEFGLHESLPIYSGGLGILAGDHCKTASDLNLPFVGVGLLYRQGYFTQTIDKNGNQIATNIETDRHDMPVTPVTDDAGNNLIVRIALPGREVAIKVWKVMVGRIQIYLMDTALDENSAKDREITRRLYGGDLDMRLRQEMVLGIGGVKVLEALGLKPNVWHLNEGHAAFACLERTRQYINEGLKFPAAFEAVAANTVFTTHTPVPAGHDQFPDPMIQEYFQPLLSELTLSKEQFSQLGKWQDSDPNFNMTALAVNGSRHQNGVSRIHGDVSSDLCVPAWPQIPADENPMGYVTNGIHVSSFLAIDWIQQFDRRIGHDWRKHLSNQDFWTRINKIPDHDFWKVKQSVKSRLLALIRETLTRQYRRNNIDEGQLERALRFIDPENPNILTVGFARRFATYKRATLLFRDIDRLRKLLANTEQPIVLIYAGKAHPADEPGQELMREIHHISQMPEFVGKVLLVEGYDLGLSRNLLAGVDVWMNTPVYPLEASGTSGMKAAINGTINLSILDGWWAEGFDGSNGWGISPASDNGNDDIRDEEDMNSLYGVLQDQLIPLYYDRNSKGISPDWVQMAKQSMMTVMPQFNMARTLEDYIKGYYCPALKQGQKLAENGYKNANTLAGWKKRVKKSWQGVTIRRIDAALSRLAFGDSVTIEAAINLNGLKPEDVAVELVLNEGDPAGKAVTAGGFISDEISLDDSDQKNYCVVRYLRFQAGEEIPDRGEIKFTLKLQPEYCGKLGYSIRVYPYHTLLAHPFELGLMRWVEENS